MKRENEKCSSYVDNFDYKFTIIIKIDLFNGQMHTLCVEEASFKLTIIVFYEGT